MNKRGKIKSWLLVVILGLSVLCQGGIIGYAEETIFVQDETGTLTNEDKAYIHQLNETTFKKLAKEPQYAVIIVKDLGSDSIEDFAGKKFKELGVGNAEANNGFLFVISLGDREYRLETGYGVEAVITDGMKADVITEDVEDYLHDEKYQQAIMGITKNVESLVLERYGNYTHSLMEIEEQAALTVARIKKVGIAALAAAVLGALASLAYVFRKKRVKKQFEKYVSPSLEVQSYQRKTGKLESNLIDSHKNSPLKRAQLSKIAVIKAMKMANSHQLVKEPVFLKKTLTTYLVEDGIINYWWHNKELKEYDISIYLIEKEVALLVEQVQGSLFKQGLLKKNPLIDSDYQSLFSTYMGDTMVTHQKNLAISKENKARAKAVSTSYLKANIKPFEDSVEEELMISLMSYYLLKDKDLSDRKALNQEALSDFLMKDAYDQAKKQRKKIEADYRQKAIYDLDQLALGSYQMQQMIMWSNYQDTSSSSSSSDSSFGGGSSGGGGFSGSW